MKRYEYARVNTGPGGVPGLGRVNEMAAEGWRVVPIEPTWRANCGDSYTYLMEREITE